MPFSVSEFISLCQPSSQAAYEQFKRLLCQLDDLATRKSAIRFLFDLKQDFLTNKNNHSNFQFLKQTILDHNDNNIELDLLQFPSTFLPEEWSFTFYEGLVRYPNNEYSGKKLVELGCGIGWISIALACRYQISNIIGLDINPKAITCARLNLYLNGFDAAGNEISFANNRPLIQCVEFHESNLFSHFSDQSSSIDRVIGCIPQVLNPEPKVMETLIEETASDEYLQSLSNYSVKQGYIEDQFGLGLIASAVEQAIPLLSNNAKLILNLGGRPGRAVIERLMRRRGFNVRRVWQTQVEQAADTEIDALVDIEKKTGHRFEFYMAHNSSTPISATTALAFAKSGGQIYHSVDVYEANLFLSDKVKSIFDSIRKIGQDVQSLSRQSLSSAVDLTYENSDDAEERYSFLAFFAKLLKKLNHFAYESTAGLDYFRQQLAEYFRFYLNVELDKNHFLVTPGRRDLIANLLANYQPKLVFIEKSLCHLIATEFNSCHSRVLESPTQIEYLLTLMESLQPNLVITRFDSHEIHSSNNIERLVKCAQRNQVLLVVDITENLDLSSQPEMLGIYRYLSRSNLPENLMVMASLSNNRVYQNYGVNIAFTNNRSILNHLTDSAELSYSRAPVLKQYYYAHLLEQLLFFQRSRAIDSSSSKRTETTPLSELPLCTNTVKAFAHPSVTGNRLQFNSQTIRLDYGENELAMPDALKATLFESYLSRNSSANQDTLKSSLQIFLKRRFELPQNIFSNIAFGGGVAAIYSSLLNICSGNKATLLMPSGSYGYFYSAALFKGLAIKTIRTEENNDFKLTAEDLNKAKVGDADCWLFLNAPINNPTGAVYSQKELNDILNAARKNRINVIIDCIFSGLEFGETHRYDLANTISAFSGENNCQLVLIGGISKEYAAGGLRFGYAWSSSRSLVLDLENKLTNRPHFTLNYAVQRLLERHNSDDVSLLAHLTQQKKQLADRAEQLTKLLTSKGWKVIKPNGGLFLVAKPLNFINENHLTATEGGDRITQLLFDKINLVVNNSTWTGLPGYCRFVLSCDQQSFNQALSRLENFEH